MGLCRILFAVFMVIPLIEIAFFVVIGNAIGLWPTLAGVLITAVARSLVLRYQGMAVFRDIQGQMRGGQLPGRSMGRLPDLRHGGGDEQRLTLQRLVRAAVGVASISSKAAKNRVRATYPMDYLGEVRVGVRSVSYARAVARVQRSVHASSPSSRYRRHPATRRAAREQSAALLPRRCRSADLPDLLA
jgi:hypothetical protein